MNSEQLNNNHNEIYKNFFWRNDLVINWNFSFPWSYEWTSNNYQSYLRIKSKLPLKCYIWFNYTTTNTIKINKLTYFNIVKKSFEEIEYNKINKKENEIIELINSEIEKIWLNKWIEIEILSETTRWHSFWFSWTVWGILAYWIYKTYDFFKNNEPLKNEEFIEKYYSNIYSLAWKIDYISRHWATLWHNVAFTLNKNTWISFFLIENYNKTSVEINTFNKLSFIFKEIKNQNEIELPFDYYIIFSWLPTNTLQVEKCKNIELNEDDISNFISKNEFLNKNPSIKKLSDNNYVNSIKFDFLNILNIKTLEFFHKIYNTPYDDNLINNFINHINNYRWALWSIEKQTQFAQDFSYFFQKNMKNPDEKLWISPAYSWKFWWWYIVITKNWLSRNNITQTISDLKNIYPDCEIEYSSYIDWTYSNWIEINQFISNWQYSDYIDKNKVSYKDNKWKTYLWNYNEIIKDEQKWLLLDTIWNKIYFDWIKLTSKDIPSQNTTIEILIKLINNIDKDISNKELPISSYSKNKNEMLWKIIIPLKNLIEKNTKEKLSLECKWSLNEFYLRIWIVNLKIWIVNKI